MLREAAKKRAQQLQLATPSQEPSSEPDPLDTERCDPPDPEADQRAWLALQFERLPHKLEHLTPSGWAESKRYLPPQVSPMPGYYRFDVAPYLREIVDCLDVNSPVREIALMKGVQIGATVGVLENALGYYIAHVKTSPMMLVTADGELAKLRMESYVTPMLQHSGLSDLIKSADVTNTRKTGKTDKKLEWEGGGFLVPQGAQNANKMRSISVQVLLRDEIDGWPLAIGSDGDPIKLTADRTAGYEYTRKVVDLSTPKIKGQSAIDKRYKLGDQRKYFVRCLGCGHSQTFRWRRTNRETGEVTGFTWKTQNGRLVPGSVRYLCEACGHAHSNDDKAIMLDPANGAEWKPTAEPQIPEMRSYHLPALYSPVGMQSWEMIARKWIEAWDDETGSPKDLEALQVFYNNCLGEPYEARGQRIAFERVSSHRRQEYRFGEIPNEFAKEHCLAPILLLTAAVDVQKDHLAIAVFGWSKDRRAFLVDYKRHYGDIEDLEDGGQWGATEEDEKGRTRCVGTWGAVRELVEGKQYTADDGKTYGIPVTLVDSGFATSTVYEFCGEYESNVYPIKGVTNPPRSARLREFSEFTTTLGTRAYNVSVNVYKERWAASLRRTWSEPNVQPVGCFNAPVDVTDAQLKELTVEEKREKKEKGTGRRVGFEWHKSSGVPNELWDLLNYNNAALDMLAHNICVGQLELEAVHWPTFWQYLEEEKPFFME